MSHATQNKDNRFKDHETHTGGLNSAFGFTPSPSAGGVCAERLMINGEEKYVRLTPFVGFNYREGINEQFHLFNADKVYLGYGEHMGFGEFIIHPGMEQVQDIEYIGVILS